MKIKVTIQPIPPGSKEAAKFAEKRPELAPGAKDPSVNKERVEARFRGITLHGDHAE